MREASTRKVMGGWPLLAASMARSCPGQAAAFCSGSQAGCAVRACSCESTRARSGARWARSRRSTALVSPVARCTPSSRAASTAACAAAPAALREYSTWWAATASSAGMGLATPEGCVRSCSTAGARRRYQRSVPSVMARIAARSGAFARLARAAPAERPQVITSSTARAAAARAGAPGAQGVLAKLPPCEGHAVRIVADGDPPAPGALHLGHTQAATTTAHQHEIIVHGDDHTRIGAFNVFYWVVIVQCRGGLCPRRQDTQRLTFECRLGPRPGIEGPGLGLDLEGGAGPGQGRP